MLVQGLGGARSGHFLIILSAEIDSLGRNTWLIEQSIDTEHCFLVRRQTDRFSIPSWTKRGKLHVKKPSIRAASRAWARRLSISDATIGRGIVTFVASTTTTVDRHNRGLSESKNHESIRATLTADRLRSQTGQPKRDLKSKVNFSWPMTDFAKQYVLFQFYSAYQVSCTASVGVVVL